MKKIFLSLFLFSFCLGAFALETQLDFLAGGFYNYDNIFTGSATYTKNYQDYDGEYRAIFTGAGGSLGFDLFFNSFPLGLYFRAGFMGIDSVNRKAGGRSAGLDNTEINFNMFYDFGGVYAFNINKYFSVCAAPAVSLIFLNSEYRDFKNIYSSRTSIDSLFGVGASADIYIKYRYKYFVASAGCAASFYPLALVTSQDTAISYSLDIRDTMAYNLRPYVSIGFTFREHTAANISAAN